MQCDKCGHEFEAAVPRIKCPECGERIEPNLNYKSPVEGESEEAENDE